MRKMFYSTAIAHASARLSSTYNNYTLFAELDIMSLTDVRTDVNVTVCVEPQCGSHIYIYNNYYIEKSAR